MTRTKLAGPVLAALAALAAIAGAAAAAPAGAAIGPVTQIQPHGVLAVQTATAAAGTRTAVLIAGYRGTHARSHGLWARLGRGTRLGPAGRLTSSTTFDPRVAVGADGTTVAAWTASFGSRSQVRYAVAEPGRPFGSEHTLPTAGAATLGGLAVTPTGRALIVVRIRAAAQPVQAAIRERGGRFGRPATIGISRQYPPAVAAAPDGALVVSWLDTPAGPAPPPAPFTPSPAVMRVRSLPAGAKGFGPVTDLVSMNTWSAGPEATYGPGGAAVDWREGAEKRVVPIGAAGALGAPESVSAAGIPAGEGHPDVLAIGWPASGPAVALWHEVQGISGDVFRVTASIVKAAVRPPEGTFGAPAQLSTAGTLAGQPQAAALDDRVLAAWVQTAAKATARACVIVLGPHRAQRCLATSGPDPNTVQAAAGAQYGVVTWVFSRGTDGGGRVAMVAYRP